MNSLILVKQSVSKGDISFTLSPVADKFRSVRFLGFADFFRRAYSLLTIVCQAKLIVGIYNSSHHAVEPSCQKLAIIDHKFLQIFWVWLEISVLILYELINGFSIEIFEVVSLFLKLFSKSTVNFSSNFQWTKKRDTDKFENFPTVTFG